MSTSPRVSRADRAARRAGLTLVEVLVALAVAAAILAITVPLLVSSLQTKSREDQYLPLQQNVRSAMEVIAQDLRESAGAHVIYSGAALTNGLSGVPTSSATRLALLVAVKEGSFTVRQPAGYPTNASYPVRANTPIVTPNQDGRTCDDVFRGGELALVYDAHPASRQSSLVQASTNNPCSGGTGNEQLQHNSTASGMSWTPTTRVIRVDGVTYFVDRDALTGLQVLYRQSFGGPAAVVAYEITGVDLTYVNPNGTTTTTPTCAPSAVRVRLTGATSRNLTGTNRPYTYTFEQLVYMRQITSPAQGATPGC